MSRSRSAGIASSAVKSKPPWPVDGVGQAVVIAREDLRAISVRWGCDRDRRSGRDTRPVGERLPPYMVPAAIVVLEALPLTVNGKPIPAPCRHRNTPTPIGTAPRPTRSRRSWPGSTPRCSGGAGRVEDSFFELGGDSLSAMRLIAAVNTGLDAGLSVRAVFEAPTVAGLAPVSVGVGVG